MIKQVYLDNNATTSLASEVLDAMYTHSSLPLNASSSHSYGQKGKQLLRAARQEIASKLNVDSDSIIFTSGGTESMNLLIRGLQRSSGPVLTTAIEHSAVYETIRSIKSPIIYVPVGLDGTPSIEAIEAAITPDTSCMIFSAVYSETGAMLELEKVAKLAYMHKIPLIIDGVALLGKELFILYPGISGMGFSGHKIHGPKGTGFAYLNPNAHFSPLTYGAHQEKGLRPGTENIEGILGLAKAVELAYEALPESTIYMKKMRDYLEESLKEKAKNISINAEKSRVCNTSSITFHGIDGETLLIALDRKGVYASLGSACSSGALEPSRILIQMGMPRKDAKSTLRFSLSRYTKKEDLDYAIEVLLNILHSF